MDSRWTLPLSLLLVSSLANGWPFFRRRDVDDNALDNPEDVLSHLSHLEQSIFGIPSNATGDRVARWHIGAPVNPEELGEYAEGDILFPRGLGRNGLIAKSTRWPGGVVPYMLSPYFDPRQKKLIMDAMNEYHRHTCVRFKPYNGEESDYVRITAGNTGCWSSVGRIGGVQDVNLQVPGCVAKIGTVIHELMHAIGFVHEQSRYERDDFVTIVWNNIMPDRRSNFDKASRKTTNAFGVGYDYASVMHYSAAAFSANGGATIVPRGKTRVEIGQREGFSARDIEKIRRMYKCDYRRRAIYPGQ